MTLAFSTYTTRFSCLLLSTTLTFFPSCALFRKSTTTTQQQQTHATTATTPSPKQSAQTKDSLFRQALTARQTWSDTMRTLAIRAQIQIQRWAPHGTDTITHKGKLLLRWQRHHGLWCVLQGPMDVEVVRFWLRPDTLVALNRMEKIAYVGKPTQVFTLLNLPTMPWDSLFTSLERFLLLLPIEKTYKWQKDSVVYLKGLTSDIILVQTFSADAQPQATSIQRITPLDTIPIFQIRFLNYQPRFHYPAHWLIVSKLFRSTLKMQTVKWNGKANIPEVRIPPSYQIQHILNSNPDETPKDLPKDTPDHAPTSQ